MKRARDSARAVGEEVPHRVGPVEDRRLSCGARCDTFSGAFRCRGWMGFMKAACYSKENKRLVVTEVDRPVPESDQALVRVASVGICGSDLTLFSSGTLPDGYIMGHEVSGRHRRGRKGCPELFRRGSGRGETGRVRALCHVRKRPDAPLFGQTRGRHRVSPGGVCRIYPGPRTDAYGRPGGCLAFGCGARGYDCRGVSRHIPGGRPGRRERRGLRGRPDRSFGSHGSQAHGRRPAWGRRGQRAEAAICRANSGRISSFLHGKKAIGSVCGRHLRASARTSPSNLPGGPTQSETPWIS